MRGGSGQQAADNGRMIGPVEAAKLLQVGQTTIQRWIDSGAILAHRTLGGHRRIRQQDLLDFARKQNLPLNLPEITRTPEPDGPPHILIVDDNRDFIKVFRLKILSLRPDIDVLKADTGFLAGFLVKRHLPRLVLLDIRMPGLSGIEVCEIIKSNPETADICVVGVTGTRDADEIDAMLNAGAKEIIFKPIKTAKLKSVLDMACPPNPRPRGEVRFEMEKGVSR